MTQTETPDPVTPDPVTPDREEPGSAKTGWWARIGVGLALSTALVWIGAIIYGMVGDYHPADYLTERTFFDTAEPICAAAMADVADLPAAPDTPKVENRIVVIETATRRLQTMVDRLRTEVPDSADGRAIGRWLDHWQIHLDDRLDFVRRLREKGVGEEFLETAIEGGQISKSLSRFAEVNQMPSCVTPGDV